MTGPWIKYQAETAPSGPWSKYQTAATESPDFVERVKGDIGIGQTMLDQGLQGATAATADEVTDRLGTMIAAPATETGQVGIIKSLIMGGGNPIDTVRAALDNKELNSLNDLSRDISKERMSQEMEQRPLLSIGSNIGGALLTGGAGATTKAGTTISNSLRAGNAATRIAKGAAAGATSGAAYGAGAADDGERLKGAGEGAIAGSVLGGAAPLVGEVVKSSVGGVKNIAKGVSARDGEDLVELGSSLKNDAVKIKNKADLKNVVLSSNKTNELASNIDKALADVELIPEYTPKTIGVINRIKEKIDAGDLNLNQLDQYRRMLGNTSGEDSAAASAVRKAIGSTLDSIKSPTDLASGDPRSIELLNQFRKDYTQASKFSEIADILKKADGDRGKIKAGLNRFLNNADNTRGWTSDELKALTVAAKSNSQEHIMNALGRFGFDKNNIAFPSLTSAGSLMSAKIALPAVATGTATRAASKYIARGKAEELLRIIENGGMVTPKQINSLPVKDAKMILEKIKGASIATQSPNLNDKKK